MVFSCGCGTKDCGNRLEITPSKALHNAVNLSITWGHKERWLSWIMHS